MLDPASQARFQRDRQAHFPPALNVIAAHVTMFHHLPGEHDAAIARVLAEAALRHAPQPFETTGIRFLGHGNAYVLAMPGIVRLRSELAATWQTWLTPQDQQRWQPHVTVQNKVPPADARRLQGRLMADFAPYAGMVQGLQLWRYLDGPWERVRHYEFLTTLETAKRDV